MVDIAIIGGGASGLIAALTAGGAGRSVCIVEKEERCGRKLLATGNGRCNLANRDFSLDHFHGSVLSKAETVFETMTPERLEEFWRQLGIDLVEGDRGKLYPRSLQASSVLNVLRRENERLGVRVMTGAEVTQVKPVKDGFLLSVTERSEKEKTVSRSKLKARKVLLCAGGKASPAFGAAGEGAKLASALGIRIAPLSPAICRLRADSPYLKRLMGSKTEGPAVLRVDGKPVMEAEGEILFTEEGLSGPPILDLSRAAGEALKESRFVEVALDLAPDYPEGRLFAYLMERASRLAMESAEEMLEGWLRKQLILPVLAEAKIDKNTPAGELDKKQLSRLKSTLKAFTFPIKSLDGFKDAQVTVGGIKGNEVTEELELVKVPGLYACGEVLDLDGDCGGYNLTWAFASAVTASLAACETIAREEDK